MARRLLAAAFAASLIFPAAASAQLMPLQDDPFWTPRFRVTPFIGYLTAVDRLERWRVNNADVGVIMHTAGANAVGINLEHRIRGSWGVTAAGAFASRGSTTAEFLDDGAFFEVEGSEMILARLSGSYTLRDRESALALRRLSASLFAGGVMIVDMPRNEPTGGQALDNAIHLGINLGLNGEMPFASDRFAVQVGIEDNIMWWGTQTPALVSAARANTWLLRAGFSFRFR
ncbi:MAG TPA: hypothetical protein VK928_00780 [Longimicrobiales bacterium]|nr:hypothetical protein [Longimicrobiales bacterium]